MDKSARGVAARDWLWRRGGMRSPMTEWQYQVRFDVKDAATAESVRHGQPYLALAPSIAKGTADGTLRNIRNDCGKWTSPKIVVMSAKC